MKEYITQESQRLEKTTVVQKNLTNVVSWRQEGIKYKKNDVFLDVIEKVNLLVARDGTVLDSEIVGTIEMKVCLSGMPELKLGLNDKVRFDMGDHKLEGPKNGNNIDLEDVHFHQCVRLATFDNDKTISFIPPDGQFDLMSYRLHTQVRPLIWVEVTTNRKATSIDYFVKAKSNFKSHSTATDVEIFVPLPSDVDTPQFNVGEWEGSHVDVAGNGVVRAGQGLSAVEDQAVLRHARVSHARALRTPVGAAGRWRGNGGEGRGVAAG